MDEILTPHEATVGSLLQLLACLLDKLGGEGVISRRDFDMVEGLPVLGRYISKDYVILRIAEDVVVVDIPPDLPQI